MNQNFCSQPELRSLLFKTSFQGAFDALEILETMVLEYSRYPKIVGVIHTEVVRKL